MEGTELNEWELVVVSRGEVRVETMSDPREHSKALLKELKEEFAKLARESEERDLEKKNAELSEAGEPDREKQFSISCILIRLFYASFASVLHCFLFPVQRPFLPKFKHRQFFDFNFLWYLGHLLSDYYAPKVFAKSKGLTLFPPLHETEHFIYKINQFLQVLYDKLVYFYRIIRYQVENYTHFLGVELLKAKDLIIKATDVVQNELYDFVINSQRFIDQTITNAWSFWSNQAQHLLSK